jgi:hypothetical protein
VRLTVKSDKARRSGKAPTFIDGLFYSKEHKYSTVPPKFSVNGLIFCHKNQNTLRIQRCPAIPKMNTAPQFESPAPFLGSKHKTILSINIPGQKMH